MSAGMHITRPDCFETRRVPSVETVVAKYGVRFLVAVRARPLCEGDCVLARNVVLHFCGPDPSPQICGSRDYRDAIGRRFETARAYGYILDGTDHGDPAESQ